MKFVLIIADGVADWPIPELGGRTPLQASDMPTTTMLAQKGSIFCTRTVPEGIPPGSDTAILSIFGYDPRLYYTGRSPLEAAGVGVSLKEGDVSFRMNLVAMEGPSLDRATLLSHNGGQIEGDAALALMDGLMTHPPFKNALDALCLDIHPQPGFRQIAVRHNAGAGEYILRPPHDFLQKPVAPLLPEGEDAQGLRELMRIAYDFLCAHPINKARLAKGKLPANGIWFSGPGRVAALPSFASLYQKGGEVISAVPLVHGIARLAGLTAPIVDGATGELDTNYAGKVDAVMDALSRHDFAAIHIEAPDEMSHAGDLPAKMEALARIDSRVVTPLIARLDALEEPYRILMMSDHATPLETRGHTGEPVPCLVYDSARPGDAKENARFDEPSAQSGRLILEGHTLLGLFLQNKAL